jgi:hypothetical protein
MARTQAHGLDTHPRVHVVERHGPEISASVMEARVTEARTPGGDLRPRAERYSTQFNSYDDLLTTRAAALEQISQVYGVDLTVPPAPGADTRYSLSVDHGRAIDDGFVGLDASRVEHPTLTLDDGTPVRVFPNVQEVSGITRTQTTVVWDAPSNSWVVVQHFPVAKDWDQATQTYLE